MRCAQVVAVLMVIAVDGAITVPNGTESTVTTSQSCVTAKHIEGTCVKRERCDYGTAVIDFTLYRPRGYKLSCSSIEDVCCPPQYLVQHDDRNGVPENEGFDFDDDD